MVKVFTKHFALKLSCVMFLLGLLGSLSAEEPYIGYAQFFGFCIIFLVLMLRFIRPVSKIYLRTRPFKADEQYLRRIYIDEFYKD